MDYALYLKKAAGKNIIDFLISFKGKKIECMIRKEMLLFMIKSFEVTLFLWYNVS